MLGFLNSNCRDIRNIKALNVLDFKFLGFIVDGVYPSRIFGHNTLFIRFNYSSLETRCNVLIVTLFYGLLNNGIDCSFLPSIWQHLTFYSRRSRIKMLLRSPTLAMCQIIIINISHGRDISYVCERYCNVKSSRLEVEMLFFVF